MTRVIEHCVTLQSVNKVVKTRHDVIKYLRGVNWTGGKASCDKLPKETRS